MPDPRDYTVGWIRALPAELTAAQVVLDEPSEGYHVEDTDGCLERLDRWQDIVVDFVNAKITAR
jgi:excinuclease UvrABC ATPase subunit